MSYGKNYTPYEKQVLLEKKNLFEKFQLVKWNSCLISSQTLNLGGRRGTTDDIATIPFHPFLSSAPSGNLQTSFPSILRCYLPISSSVFLSLFISLSL